MVGTKIFSRKLLCEECVSAKLFTSRLFKFRSYFSTRTCLVLPLVQDRHTFYKTQVHPKLLSQCPEHLKVYVTKRSYINLRPREFAQYLKKHKIARAYVVADKHEKGRVDVSHPELEEIAKFVEENKHFAGHEAIFMNVGIRSSAFMVAFIWSTTRGLAQGGASMLKYDSLGSLINDGLQLSTHSGIKSALAGLWVGGGKAIICKPKGGDHHLPDFREKLFYDFGDFLTSLNGCYVSSTDRGCNVTDLTNAYSRTRYVTGIAEYKGGSGNPSLATGKGVICAMEAALNFQDLGSLKGKRVAIQGAGNVGQVLVNELLEKGVDHIYVTDIHQNQLETVHNQFWKPSHGRLTLEKVDEFDRKFFSYPCHVLAPCAYPRVLTKETIPMLQASVICGSANNQLENEEDGKTISDMGIAHVCDTITNRMALINFASEPFGRQPHDPWQERHFDPEWEDSIYSVTKKILQKSNDESISTTEACNNLGEELCKIKHPLWPDRGRQIIDSLIQYGWHQEKDYWKERDNLFWGHSMGV